MSVLCRIIGHRWLTFNQEQCPAAYRRCLRCDEFEHPCNANPAAQVLK
jgi:hypothetical protein